jgi:polyhydroxyalkanoate synthesis regulator phasin
VNTTARSEHAACACCARTARQLTKLDDALSTQIAEQEKATREAREALASAISEQDETTRDAIATAFSDLDEHLWELAQVMRHVVVAEVEERVTALEGRVAELARQLDQASLLATALSNPDRVLKLLEKLDTEEEDDG